MTSWKSGAADPLKDPRFHQVIRARRGLRVGFSMVTLSLFFGFVFAISTPIAAGAATVKIVGVPLEMFAAFGLIVLIILMTGFYVLWSNSRIDPLVEALRREHRS